MDNKSLFISITLALALMIGFFFHNQQITQLEQKIGTITSEHNAEIEAIQFNAKVNDSANDDDNNSPNISTLEDLNNQLITARSTLKITQQKLSLASSKSTVLNDEISQIKDTRGKVKSLKTSLKKSEQKLQVSDKKLKVSDKKLQVSDQKLDYLQRVFESQNKNTASNNIARITELQGSAAGIGIGGLLIPIVGVAMLTSYTVKEINNYCANIKNIINLEEKVFKKVVSLDAQMQKDYHQKCIASLLDAPQ